MALNRTEIELLIKARNDAQGAFDGLTRQIKGVTGEATKASAAIETTGKKTASAGAGATAAGVAFGILGERMIRGVVSSFKSTLDAANRLDAGLIGLSSVAGAFGQSADLAKQAAIDLASDGLMSVGEAATALKNLLAAGFGLPEAITLVTRFKDTAAFGRQAALGFGQAITSATEGIKNGNSILVDNAGVTKNLSNILVEAGFSATDLSKATTDANVRMALFNGLVKETAPQLGDAARLLDTAAGKQAQFSAQVEIAQQKIGKALQPALAALLDVLIPVVQVVGELAPVLIPLAAAFTAAVIPMVAMKSAAALGIPSIRELGTSIKGLHDFLTSTPALARGAATGLQAIADVKAAGTLTDLAAAGGGATRTLKTVATEAAGTGLGLLGAAAGAKLAGPALKRVWEVAANGDTALKGTKLLTGQVGQQLLTAGGQAVATTGKFAAFFGGLGTGVGVVGRFVFGMGGLVSTIGWFSGKGIGNLILKYNEWAKAQEGLTKQVMTFGGFIPTAVSALDGLGFVIGQLMRTEEDLKIETELVTQANQRLRDSMGDAAPKVRTLDEALQVLGGTYRMLAALTNRPEGILPAKLGLPAGAPTGTEVLARFKAINDGADASRAKMREWQTEINGITVFGGSKALQQLKTDLDLGVLSTKELATTYRVSEDAIKFFEKQLKSTADQKRDSTEAAKKLAEEQQKLRDQLEGMGLTTLPALNLKLKELAALKKRATEDGTPLIKVAQTLDQAYFDLYESARQSGVGIDVARKAMEANRVEALKTIPVITGWGNVMQASVKLPLPAMSEHQRQIGEVAKAYAFFGSESRQELEATARKAEQHYLTIVASVGRHAPIAIEAWKRMTDAQIAASGNVVQQHRLGLQQVAVEAEVKYAQIAATVGKHAPEAVRAFQEMVAAQNAAAGTIPSKWRTEVMPGVVDAIKQIGSQASNTFAQMLLGAKGFGDGFKDIWTSVKSAAVKALSDVLNYFLNTFMKGILAAMRGGSFTSAFAGMFGGGGGGLGGLFGGAGAGAALPGGIAIGGGGLGMGGVGGAAAGGGAAGGGLLAGLFGGGAAAGGGLLAGLLGKKLFGGAGKKAGLFGAGGGAATGALIGSIVPGIGTAIGAVIGGLGGLVGGLFGKSKGRKQDDAANAELDTYRSQLLTVYGSLDDIRKVGGAAGEELAAAWGDRGKKGLENFQQKLADFEKQLQQNETNEQARAENEAQRAEKRAALAEKFEGKIADLGQQAKSLYDSIADEAPEAVMGVVETQTRAKIKAIEDQQKALKESYADALKELEADTGRSSDDMMLTLGPNAGDKFKAYLERGGVRGPFKHHLDDMVGDAHGAADGVQDAFEGVRIRIPIDYDMPEGGVPAPGGGTPPIEGAAAGGVMASRPGLVIFGEGGETEIGGPKRFFKQILTELGAEGSGLAAGGGGGLQLTFNITNMGGGQGLRQTIETDVLPIIEDLWAGNRRGSRTKARTLLGVQS